MTPTFRGARIGAIAATTLALSGCVKATADTTFHEDETFSQHAIVAYEPSIADDVSERLGFDVDTVIGSLDESPEFLALQEEYPGQLSLTDYDDGEMTGVELTVTNMPLEAFSEASEEVLSSVGVSASVTLADDQYVVSVTQSSSDALALLSVSPEQRELIAGAVDVSASLTFPGEVQSATVGEVAGSTVTLGLADLATTPEIRIVANAQASLPWDTILTWAAVVAGFAIVIGGATALIIQDRRAARRTTLPDPVTSTPAGPGILGADAEAEQPPNDERRSDNEGP